MIVDLREWASPVEEQWNLGSCTAQAVVGAYELLLRMHYPAQFKDLSRLFLYYNSRKLEKNIEYDNGAFISTAIKAIKMYGLCVESLWPYNIDKFKIEPPWQCYADARNRTIKQEYSVNNINDIKKHLNDSRPVVVGVNVFDEFNGVTDESVVLTPPLNDNNILGSHAMCVVGYDDTKSMFIVRNSFGTDWAEDGYIWIPYNYAEENFGDMWAFDILLKSKP